MNLLLFSNSTNYGEPYLAWALNQIEYFCEKNQINAKSNILFVPFAGGNIAGKAYPASYDAYEARVKAVFENLGFSHLSSVHTYRNKAEAVAKADCIVVGGGNTFHLVDELHAFKLMEDIR